MAHGQYDPTSEARVLHLTEEEAQALADVLTLVGGAPTGTRRWKVESVTRALHQAGIWGNPEAYDVDGEVTFFPPAPPAHGWGRPSAPLTHFGEWIDGEVVD